MNQAPATVADPLGMTNLPFRGLVGPFRSPSFG